MINESNKIYRTVAHALPATFKAAIIMTLLVASTLLGCATPAMTASQQNAYTQFHNAGPKAPTLDRERLIRAKYPIGLYEVTKGDVIEFHMPIIMRAINKDLNDAINEKDKYLCRVNPEGKIPLPIVGYVQVEHFTIPEIEEKIQALYYPKYLVNPPSIVGKMFEYKTDNISVNGAVNKPGIHKCHHDEMTLISALMKAGGIVSDGASVINVYNPMNNMKTKPIVLPVKGLNIPFTDIEIHPNDRIEVEPLTEQVFTVIGLVNNPGVFPYPSHTTYSALQGLAFAGGLNKIADPHHLRILRKGPDGETIDVGYNISGDGMVSVSTIDIKPGDVITVESTVRTATRLMASKIFLFTARFNASN